MKFSDLTQLIKQEAENVSKTFDSASDVLKSNIFSLNLPDLKEIVKDIGIIPEDIEHDSTEEKLFSKATDIVLAKILQELGLSSTVNKERANCADVVAKSSIHGYSLVGDAKAFRLSRTAKNQKDFKVKSMDDWRGDNDFALLVCPYYQYPKNNSQIYGQALDKNVCLLGWEHLLLLLENSIMESKDVNLSVLWNLSGTLAASVTVKDKNKNTNFHERGNSIICESLQIDNSSLLGTFSSCRSSIVLRGESEIEFWERRIEEIEKLTREQAIIELVSALKLREKMSAIRKYISALRRIR